MNNFNNNSFHMQTNKLKEIAKSKGIMAKELADILGTTKETVSRHMNGKIAISHDFVERYADALDVPPEWIIFEPKGIDVLGRIMPNFIVEQFTSFEEKTKTATAPFSFPPNTAAVLGGNDKEQEFWTDYTLYVFCRSAMANRIVEPETNNRLSIIKHDGNIKVGRIWKSSRTSETNKVCYDIENTRMRGDGSMKREQDVVWATPILTIYTEPKLLGIVIID